MSKEMFSDNENSSMMAGLLYAMKGTCNCPACIALKDMSDKLITKAQAKKPSKRKK